MSQWEDVLKGQAKEASEGASKLRADQASQEKKIRERSEAVEAEERRAEKARKELEGREEALGGREAELAELEAGREARAADLEGVRDRLALLEKGLEGQRADLAKRKVLTVKGTLPYFVPFDSIGSLLLILVFNITALCKYEIHRVGMLCYGVVRHQVLFTR